MIFRRSLVREMTATAIGLFLVLMAILFTNLVLRLLAPRRRRYRRAGRDPRAARLQRPLLLQYPALGHRLRDRAAHAYPLVPRQRDDRLVQLGAERSPRGCGRSCGLPLPFFAAILVLSLYLSPWAEQRRLEYERQLESRDEITLLTPGLFREFGRANLVVFVESINTFDGTIRNVFLHSVDEGKDSTTVARSGIASGEPRTATASSCSTDGRRYEGKPGTADYQIVEFGSLGRRIEPAELRALPASTKAIPTATLIAPRRPRRAGRALLAPLGADLGVRADAARGPARLRESADRPLVQPDGGRVHVHAVQQLPQHRAELHRAGQARVRAGSRAAARDRDRRRAAALRTPAQRCSALLRRGRAPKAAPA